MKPSRYAFLFDIEDGKALLFSAANGALAEIDSDSFPVVKNLLSTDDTSSTDFDTGIRDAMIQNGFLVDCRTNELDELERNSREERLNGKCMSLTIAPTLACNFDCDYCFESHSAIRMSQSVEQAVLKFVEERLDKMDSLLLTWFGGEPTLCLPTIERLHAGFQTLAVRHDIEIEPASIITNGYLLDESMAKRLKNLGITTAQVTLDGPREMHDRRRHLKGGRGTYDRIIGNVAESCDIINIVIRINIDRDNLDSAIEVVQELNFRGIASRVNVHFAQVTASGSACSSVRDRCFTDREFSRHIVDLYHRLSERGIHILDYPEVFSGGHCGAVSEDCYVISPTGDLFRCWEELSLSPERSTGNIFAGSLSEQQQINLDRYRSWDPFVMSGCRQCDILPICMGGCPLHGMQSSDRGKGACSPFKYNLKDMLVLRYLYDARKEVST